MIYAPVLISTVNRYQHFKDCIESLSRCTWADKTDVFVAVDYPPSENYWEGYKQIKDYLDNCNGLGFKSLNVIYRETNYFYTERGNLGALVDEVEKNYDRYIISEDDNVFSPCFLEYIDKGLEKFKEDKSVMAIVGYTHPMPIKYSKNTYFRQNVDFSAWGYGTWRNKMNPIRVFFTSNGFYKYFSITNARKLYKNGKCRFCMYLRLASKKNNNVILTDNHLSVYLALNDMDIIMPTKSLVRNQGWDDSGIHCPTSDKELAEKHMKQEISSDLIFEYVGTGFEYYDDNKNIYVKNGYVQLSFFNVFISLIKFIVKRILSFFRII